MNERIVKLFMQSVDSKYIPLPVEDHIPLWTEKFAELIVRECCDVLQGEDIRYGGYGYNQGFLHKKIKEHFGVEE